MPPVYDVEYDMNKDGTVTPYLVESIPPPEVPALSSTTSPAPLTSTTGLYLTSSSNKPYIATPPRRVIPDSSAGPPLHGNLERHKITKDHIARENGTYVPLKTKDGELEWYCEVCDRGWTDEWSLRLHERRSYDSSPRSLGPPSATTTTTRIAAAAVAAKPKAARKGKANDTIARHLKTVAKFLNCFPEGYEREDVSGERLLCSLRALSRSVELQFGGTIAPTIEELHTFAQSAVMDDKEKHITMGNGVRSLERDYSVDQLASIQLWCGVHERDLVFGCLMSTGLLNLYNNDNTTAATSVVWLYSSNDGRLYRPLRGSPQTDRLRLAKWQNLTLHYEIRRLFSGHL
ncbi:hypothetical protein B0H65DRAFT_549492 [Neurospora tetraspora]|uniref:C2H2-type domain-containing protein n=1 Tax=Neurospora tetraspora TaxID=94610 RepID=A0AAE0JBQ0_9PEZI|nr:hypothetical protein B0H65DRAFT_549492 [Neurospora tetraspora]